LLPTLNEINVAAPDTSVFILHLYDRAFIPEVHEKKQLTLRRLLVFCLLTALYYLNHF